MESVYDQMFNMKYYGRWSLIELYNLPVGLRNWFAEKLIKRIEDENKRNSE